jgi:hypothetical protein
MPCIYGITDPIDTCRGTDCRTCTGWDELCAGCGEVCAKGDSLCPGCERQLQAQPTGWEKAARVVGALLLALLLAANAQAKHRYKEEYYQKKWCEAHGGTTEYVLPDRTRVDCLTEDHAIEFDFGYKHYESMGQAIKYGMATGQRPGIVLIIETGRDAKKWVELQEVVIFLRERFGLRIDTWWMEGE